MTQRLMKYNPAFLSPDQLVEAFVVRHTDLELIVEIIRNNAGESNSHILVIGPRGVGKKTLVLRTVAEVSHDAELAQQWHPIVFGEESYEVCSPGEFWLEALFHLADEAKQDRWLRTYLELRSEKDETRLRERAFAQLMDFSDEQGKRILLVVENLNMILGQQIAGDDAWVLRHALLNEPRIMLLGTATSRFEEIENAGKAMYDLFKVHDLKPLDTNDCRIMWTAITKDVLSEGRVRPIEILTGGNPRLLSIIANFAAKTSFRELMLDLTQLIDDHTEYFKSHLDGLPPLERKVFVALADLWDPVSAREAAKAARVEVNMASSLLNRLVSRGAVVVFEKNGRKKWYQVAERMYNIYHLMRRRGGPSGRIWAAVNFMIQFYQSDDLVQVGASIAEEKCRLNCELREDHYLAYQTLLQNIPSKELTDKILRMTPEQFFEMPDTPATLKESFYLMKSASLEEAQASRSPKEKRQARRIAGRKPRDAASLVALGSELQSAGRLREAERFYREAIKLDKDLAEAWRGLAIVLYDDSERYPEAEAAYRKLIELQPHDVRAWDRLGDLLSMKLGRIEEACEAYHTATEIDPTYVWAWIGLGDLIREKLDGYAQAEAAYRKAIELDPSVWWGWAGLGELLHEKLGRYEEAEAAYRKAIELDPSAARGWRMLGRLLRQKLGRYEEAEEAYRYALELDPSVAWGWTKLGELLHEEFGRYEEAEAAYQKAIELDPDVARSWGMLGILLHEKLGKYEEAEAAYRKANELEPNVVLGWAKLGELLHRNLGRYNEAQTAYLTALELDDKSRFVWKNLIELQMKNLNDPGSALNTAQRHIEGANRSRGSLIDAACVFADAAPRDLYPQVAAWVREAIEKKPEEWHERLTLAGLLASFGSWQEALDLMWRFLTNALGLDDAIGDITDFFIFAAASGYPKEAFDVLRKSSSAHLMEPLVAGLQIFMGEEPAIAREILEVGRDVAKRIEARQEQRKGAARDDKAGSGN